MPKYDFKALTERMARSGIAGSSDLIGCSVAEIEALEQRYRVSLPDLYRDYLFLMGHSAGSLFTHDHIAVTYRYVLAMTDEHFALPAQKEVALPSGSLLISGRLGEQFEFIRAVGGMESSVWYFNLWDREIVLSHPSVAAWLECWCSEAEAAIKEGYYDRYPNGTTP